MSKCYYSDLLKIWHRVNFTFTCTVPCVLTEHHAMKAYWGSGGIAPHIFLPRH